MVSTVSMVCFSQENQSIEWFISSLCTPLRCSFLRAESLCVSNVADRSRCLERVFRRKAVFKCGRIHDIWRFLKSCEIPKSPWVSILKWSNHRMIWEYPYDLGNLHLDTFIGDYNLWPTLFSNKLLTPMDANTEHEFKMNSKPNES